MTADAALDETREQRSAIVHGTAAVERPPVLTEALLVAFEQLPRDVARVVVPNDDRAFGQRLIPPDLLHAPAGLDQNHLLPATPGVGSRVEGARQYSLDMMVDEGGPLDRSACKGVRA